MIKILTVVGARPQFVKAAVLSRLIRSLDWRDKFSEVIVHTGQHYDANMSDVFFSEMEIPLPDYNLNIGSASHGKMTGEMLIGIESILFIEKPDLLLVYGDTNSTLAGALAASKIHIPVVHIEAGLRSFNMRMPEEQNRILTDKLSKFLFCPTQQAVINLQNEGVKENIHMVGDIMFDASLHYRKKLKHEFLSKLKSKYNFEEFVLATVHRAENTDSPENLKEILDAFGSIKDIIILPLHPRTKSKLESLGLKIPDNVIVTDPVSYFEMLELESECNYIITDSGGVQKEAYFFQKPCFTIRTETEWTESVESGWNVITGPNKEKLIKAISEFVKPDTHPELYGNGDTGERILTALIHHK